MIFHSKRELDIEFHEKLQELRKRKGMTQEELAATLYVSRTAVSKWESGRGYPNIDSLKALASFFSVTVDELLSSDQLLSIAEEEQKQVATNFRDLAFGLLDLCMAILLFLPFFASRADGVIHGASLLSLTGVSPYLKFFFFAAVIATVLSGVFTLALQTCRAPLWLKCKPTISLTLSGISVLLFILGLHPYAAVFTFVLLTVKVFLLTKRP